MPRAGAREDRERPPSARRRGGRSADGSERRTRPRGNGANSTECVHGARGSSHFLVSPSGSLRQAAPEFRVSGQFLPMGENRSEVLSWMGQRQERTRRFQSQSWAASEWSRPFTDRLHESSGADLSVRGAQLTSWAPQTETWLTTIDHQPPTLSRRRLCFCARARDRGADRRSRRGERLRPRRSWFHTPCTGRDLERTARSARDLSGIRRWSDARDRV